MQKTQPHPERLLQRLEWTILRPLDGLMQGDYRSLFHGSGLDLADLRQYQFGDDPRTIDWNVTARMRETFVRTFLEDRELDAWFLVDISPSLDFGTVTVRKRDLVIDLASLVARLLTRHGNRIGACLYDGTKIRIIPPSSGRNQVLRFIAEMQEPPDDKPAPSTDLSTLLLKAVQVIRRRSLLFILSDFISVPGWERILGRLRSRNDIIAVRVHDPREWDLPDIGSVWLQDAETGEQIFIDTHSLRFRKRFTEAARARDLNIRSILKKNGTDLLSLSTQDDLVKAIFRFAAFRKNRSNRPVRARSGGNL